jgi:AraC-like DNA-binding protein
MGLQTALIRPKLTLKFHNNLIPDFHYAAVDCDDLSDYPKLADAYIDKFEYLKSNPEHVKFLADNVHLSPSYLSDLLRKETGKNAQEHIHFYLIDEAKNLLLNSEKNVSEIAYDLGFEYPQYFNKLFKKKTGKTPMEYRNLN